MHFVLIIETNRDSAARAIAIDLFALGPGREVQLVPTYRADLRGIDSGEIHPVKPRAF